MSTRTVSCFDRFLHRPPKAPALPEPSISGISQRKTKREKLKFGLKEYGIKILSPEDRIAQVDIVAIHGLNGHREATWTDMDGAQALWLRDFLPEDIEKARVMTFGYDSKVVSNSVSEIPNFAEQLLCELDRNRSKSNEKVKRPLIFICHSLGGIVCKKALVLADDGKKYPDILTSTYGVIFMGTPHKGSQLATLASIPGALGSVLSVGGFGKNIRWKLVQDLGRGSEVLDEISESFADRGAMLKIVTCYEQSIIRGLNQLVVSEQSAKLGLRNEILQPIAADHRAICRFGERGSNYKSVLGHLNRFCEESIVKREGESRRERSDRQTHTDTQKEILAALRRGRVGGPDQSVPDESYSDESDTPSGDTCEWVLRDPNYKSWVGSSSPTVLGLSGEGGTGKTVISKFIAQKLKETEDPECRPVYAFISCRPEDIPDLSIPIRSILRQILEQDNSLFEYIEWRIDKILRNTREMWVVLEEMMLGMKETLFITVDGVDELKEDSRKSLLERLRHLMDSAQSKPGTFNQIGPRLKILLSSRPHIDIASPFKSLAHWKQLLLSDNEGYINADIRKFASEGIDNFTAQNAFSIRSQDKTEIEDAIVEGAQGMFLWASLALSNFLEIDSQERTRVWEESNKMGSRWKISDLNSEGIRRKINLLKNLPQSLDALYSRMLQDIPEDCANETKVIFRCLLGATRPLTVAEITAILNLKKKETEVDRWCSSTEELEANTPELIWRTRIKLSCGPFVSINNNNVRLLHQTVREFLTWQPSVDHLTRPPDPVPIWKFRLEDVHHDLATFCLTYLSFTDFKDGLLKYETGDKSIAEFRLECEEEFRKHISQHPLLEYASVCWPHHAHHAASTDEFLRRFKHFAGSCENLSHALQVFWFSEGCGGPFPHDMTPLHVISYYGIHTFVNKIPSNNPHAMDIYSRTPLHWATINGHLTTVKELLELNDDINPSPSISSPLHFAADRGHLELIKLFLGKGANLNAFDEELGSPLQIAAYSGHLDVTKLLLENGADINAQYGELGTPLQAAAYAGHLDLVKLLLDRNADVNANSMDSTFRYALQATLGEPLITRPSDSKDHECEILKLLLDKGAELNASGGLYGDALQAAATHGKIKAVELLLDMGAVLTNRGGDSGSALEAAAAGGHDQVIIKLLNSPDRVDAQRDVLESAKEIATDNGYHNVSDMLKEHIAITQNSNPSQRFPLKDQGDATDKVIKWGVWTFKRLVKGGRQKEADLIVKGVVETFHISIASGNRTLVKRISSAGAEALQAVIRIPDDRMVRNLVQIGLSVLQIAIAASNESPEKASENAKAIVKEMSEIWIVALESAIEGKQRGAVETVMNNAASQFKSVLDEADEKSTEAEGLPGPMKQAKQKEAEGKERDATTLSHAAIELLLAAVSGGKNQMVDCLANVIAKALDRGVEGMSSKRVSFVQSLVRGRANEFEDALENGLADEAEAISKAGLALLLSAVELKSKNLVKIISTIWANVLALSISNGHRVIVEKLVSERASAFQRAVYTEREAKAENRGEDQLKAAAAKVDALTEAGLALLMAAVEEGLGTLIDSMSGIWATVLHSASENGNMGKIKSLVTDRASDFERAILKTRDGDEQATLDADPALSEAEALSRVGLAILAASVESGNTALTETISSIWVNALDSAVKGNRGNVMGRLVQSRAEEFQLAKHEKDTKKRETLLKVAVALSEAAGAEQKTQLANILNKIWLPEVHSIINENDIVLIRTLENDRSAAFKRAVNLGFSAKADTILFVELELLRVSITLTKGSILIIDEASKIWAEALQDIAGQGHDILEKLRAFKQEAERKIIASAGSAAEGLIELEESIAAVGLILLLAAMEGSMEEVMDALVLVWGKFSLDLVDQGRYGGVLKTFVKNKTKMYLEMRRANKGASGAIGTVMDGNYGPAAKSLLEEAMSTRSMVRVHFGRSKNEYKNGM